MTDRSGTPLGGGTGTSDAVAGERAVFRVTRIGAAAADDVRDLRAVVRLRNCGHGRARARGVRVCVLVGVLVFCVCLRSVARVQRLRLVRQIRSPSGKETRVELVPAAGGADGAYALRSNSVDPQPGRHARKRATPARVCVRRCDSFDGLSFAAMARGSSH